MNVLSHRGINASNRNWAIESTKEAFQFFINKNIGLELDVNYSKDNKVFIFHDPTLTRISGGKDMRRFSELELQEIKSFDYYNGTVCDLGMFFSLIAGKNGLLHALHLKGNYQKGSYIDTFIKELNIYRAVLDSFFIFDVIPEVAKHMASRIEGIRMAPSVAHTYDIIRFNKFVYNTLLSTAEALKYKKLYQWAWLDEWDTLDENGKEKIFYSQEVIGDLRSAGYKIAIVSPELHGTSPGLLAAERHPDSVSEPKLFKRIQSIIDLRPDAICTDYAVKISKIVN